MKAQGLSMGVVVTAALAVIVLLLVGIFFSGGFRAMGSKMTTFVTGATGDVEGQATQTQCDIWCTRAATGNPPAEDPNSCADTC